MRILCTASASLLALAAALPAHAEESATSVDEVIVTATRLPTTPVDAPGVHVVTADEIERTGALFAADVLVTVPGVSLYSEGAFGGQTSVRLRGATADKTLVLVDGVPLNDPSAPSGAYDFSSLSLAEVDRIEVLTGPQSSLWGSSAIGGVVSITTRELDGVSAELEGGSFDTLRGRIAVGTADDDRALSAFVSGLRTDGISKADEADGNPEEDGFETWTAGAAARQRLGERVEVDGRVRYSESEIDLDGYPAPFYLLGDTADRSESRTWSGFGRVRIEGPAEVTHALSVSLYDVERQSFGDFTDRYTADRQVWRYVAERDLPGERFGFAGGVEHEEVRGDTSSDEAELSTTSVFAVGRFRPSERLTASLGLRHDAPDDFDGETTFRASLVGDLGGGFRAGGSYGTGFKTPTVSQILCDFCFAPPMALTPETAEGFDVSLGWRSADRRFEASATAFRLDVEDQIAYVGGRYENISRTTADGIELEARAGFGGGFSLKAAYTYTDAADRSTGLRLLRVPEHSGSATLFWAGDRFSGALTMRGESEQTDVDGFGTGVRDGFVTADVAAAWQVTEQIELTARVENLFDERYQEVLGYGEPGLSGYLGVRLRY